MPRLAAARGKLYQRWLRIERADIMQDIKARDLKEKSHEPPTSGHRMTPQLEKRRQSQQAFEHPEMNIPIEDRIQLHLISDPVRWTFIDNELRTRRYMLLPQLTMWEEDVKSWNKELAEWEEERATLQVMGVGGAASDGMHGMLRWPPQRPTYMPAEFGKDKAKGEEEVLDMIRRARAHPDGGGWTEVPKKTVGKTVSETMGALQAKQQGDDEEHPFGRPSPEELKSYQVCESTLPMEFRETAPNVKTPEWRTIP